MLGKEHIEKLNKVVGIPFRATDLLGFGQEYRIVRNDERFFLQIKLGNKWHHYANLDNVTCENVIWRAMERSTVVHNTVQHKMDDCQKRHFQAWLKHTIPEDEQEQVRHQIYALIGEYPHLLEKHSWPEIRNLTD